MKLKLGWLPAKLNDLIERGEESLPERRIFARAVVGSVYFKGENEAMADLTVRLATEYGMVVLKRDNKDIQFLVNYFETANWPLNLICFFEALMQQTSGRARGAVSQGPATLTHDDNRGFQLESAESELAPRLARVAMPGQMVLTSKVWHALADALEGWTSASVLHELAGFSAPVPTLHLHSRLAHARKCAACSSSLEVKQTAEGYIFVACSQGHEQIPELPIKLKRAA
ncbi:MAG: hypothetical protein KF799_06945 [Bdellovibrionales bacterium]|nr:hypothetical protein [Bdellovibrionales bacterium]